MFALTFARKSLHGRSGDGSSSQALSAWRRRWSKVVASAALSGLIFTQLTLAAYACQNSDAAAAASPAAAAEVGKPCHGEMDHGQATLCERHCIQNAQSVDTLPALALAPPILPLMAVAYQDRHAPRRTSGAALYDIPRSPPPLARFCVLRI